jgi:hypothetical protein
VAAATLSGNYDTVYAGGILEVGLAGSAGFSMRFTGPGAVISYLPATGTVGALTSDLVDPTSTSSGSLGGNVVALKLNVDFDDANILANASATPFGDLLICNLSALPLLQGLSVRAFLDILNTGLGGGSTVYSLGVLNNVATLVNGAFEGGTPTDFAQQSLVNSSACPTN